MSRWYERANEASFRPVEGGYVFQCPNPWVLARPSYYLVNDRSKAEILLHLGRWRLMMVLLAAGLPLSTMLIPVKSMASILLPAYLALGVAPFSLLLFAALILPMAALIAVPQIYLARSLRRVLADAPRTEERIRLADQLPRIAASASRTVLIVGLLGAVVMIVSGGAMLVDAFGEGHLARSAFPSSLLMGVGALMVAYFVYLLRLKRKLRHAAAGA